MVCHILRPVLVAPAVNRLLSGGEDGAREFDHLFEGNKPDTGSTDSFSSMMVQRAGVSKIPAWLVAKLYSGAAYMCCFDGGVTWGEELHEGGGGACFFRIRSDGVKNGH